MPLPYTQYITPNLAQIYAGIMKARSGLELVADRCYRMCYTVAETAILLAEFVMG
jgi:hypothetical protein